MKMRSKYQALWMNTDEEMRVSKTDEWRHRHPVINHAKCRRCGWCAIYCITGCIKEENDRFVPDLNYCKGCGVCANECPAEAIELIREDVVN